MVPKAKHADNPPPSTQDTRGAVTQTEVRAQERLAAALARAEQLVRAGQLPARPSANQIHKALGGAMDTARAVRDALRGPDP